MNYQEADGIVADWKYARCRSRANLARDCRQNERDAFFELVLYPVKACAIVNELYIDGREEPVLRAARAGPARTTYAARPESCFRPTPICPIYYNHTFAGGKWDHMMDQTHIGYSYWQQPSVKYHAEGGGNRNSERRGDGRRG